MTCYFKKLQKFREGVGSSWALRVRRNCKVRTLPQALGRGGAELGNTA